MEEIITNRVTNENPVDMVEVHIRINGRMSESDILSKIHPIMRELCHKYTLPNGEVLHILSYFITHHPDGILVMVLKFSPSEYGFKSYNIKDIENSVRQISNEICTLLHVQSYTLYRIPVSYCARFDIYEVDDSHSNDDGYVLDFKTNGDVINNIWEKYNNESISNDQKTEIQSNKDKANIIYSTAHTMIICNFILTKILRFPELCQVDKNISPVKKYTHKIQYDGLSDQLLINIIDNNSEINMEHLCDIDRTNMFFVNSKGSGVEVSCNQMGIVQIMDAEDVYGTKFLLFAPRQFLNPAIVMSSSNKYFGNNYATKLDLSKDESATDSNFHHMKICNVSPDKIMFTFERPGANAVSYKSYHMNDAFIFAESNDSCVSSIMVYENVNGDVVVIGLAEGPLVYKENK